MSFTVNCLFCEEKFTIDELYLDCHSLNKFKIVKLTQNEFSIWILIYFAPGNPQSMYKFVQKTKIQKFPLNSAKWYLCSSCNEFAENNEFFNDKDNDSYYSIKGNYIPSDTSVDQDDPIVCFGRNHIKVMKQILKDKSFQFKKNNPYKLKIITLEDAQKYLKEEKNDLPDKSDYNQNIQHLENMWRYLVYEAGNRVMRLNEIMESITNRITPFTYKDNPRTKNWSKEWEETINKQKKLLIKFYYGHE